MICALKYLLLYKICQPEVTLFLVLNSYILGSNFFALVKLIFVLNIHEHFSICHT